MTAILTRRKTKAEAAAVITDSALKILAEYRKDIDRLTSRVEALEEENLKLLDKVQRLEEARYDFKPRQLYDQG